MYINKKNTKELLEHNKYPNFNHIPSNKSSDFLSFIQQMSGWDLMMCMSIVYHSNVLSQILKVLKLS